LAAGQPAISVDTKKRDLVGDPRVKPVGMLQEWRPRAASEATARAGAGARFSDPGAWSRRAVWGL
jgi:hypothetical protein